LVGNANQAAPRKQRDEEHQKSDGDQPGRAGLKVVLIDEQQDGGASRTPRREPSPPTSIMAKRRSRVLKSKIAGEIPR